MFLMVPNNPPGLHKSCGGRFVDPEDPKSPKNHDIFSKILVFAWHFMVFLVRTPFPAADTLTAGQFAPLRGAS